MSRTDSVAPPEANPPVRRPAPGAGPEGPLGFVWASIVMAWRWLTRMRTALYLLGLLGLLTLVATVVPQAPNVPSTVEGWLAGEEGPGAGIANALDVAGAFDVYGSPVFLALLLLLFLSLTACLVPRVRAWVRLVRRSRPPLVRTVGRRDEVATFATDRTPDEVHDAAASLLAERRWRLRDGREEPAEGRPPQIAGERGLWSREGGSLLFHLSFYVLVTAIVLGQLLTFEGQRGVVEGEVGFSDTPVSYWSYRPGRWFGEGDHAAWRLDLDRFEVDWIRDPTAPGAGQPTTFRSEVTITPAEGEPFEAVVAGNEPLVVDGMKIHQLDWGYAPLVRVDVDGEVVREEFLTSQAADGGFFRAAVKAPGADPDVGLEVFLYPFAPTGSDGQPQLTGAPWDDEPLLLYRQWRGDLQLGATQQTINELDTTRLDSEGGAFIRLGQQVELEGVTVTFLELRRWVGFQVSIRPQIPWLLLGSALLVAGLVPALYAYRRRLWVLATRPTADGPTLVTVAGRAFQRADAFAQEHARITAALATATSGGAVTGADGSTDGPSTDDPSPDDRTAPAPTDADPEVVPR